MKKYLALPILALTSCLHQNPTFNNTSPAITAQHEITARQIRLQINKECGIPPTKTTQEARSTTIEYGDRSKCIADEASKFGCITEPNDNCTITSGFVGPQGNRHFGYILNVRD